MQQGTTIWNDMAPAAPASPARCGHTKDLKANGELTDVFDGNERVVGVVIQRPYMRQVYVP
jgi:hypothetical protein